MSGSEQEYKLIYEDEQARRRAQRAAESLTSTKRHIDRGGTEGETRGLVAP